jgi:hypothetical protein
MERIETTSFNIPRIPEGVMAQPSSPPFFVEPSCDLGEPSILPSLFGKDSVSTSTGVIVDAPRSWRGYLGVPEKSACSLSACRRGC